MGTRRNNGQSEEKRNIIRQFIEMYDIKTAAGIQEALKDLSGGTFQSIHCYDYSFYSGLC